MVFEPIFSLCVMILAANGASGSSIGLSKCRNVNGGGDKVGGFNRLVLYQQIAGSNIIRMSKILRLTEVFCVVSVLDVMAIVVSVGDGKSTSTVVSL